MARKKPPSLWMIVLAFFLLPLKLAGDILKAERRAIHRKRGGRR